MDPLFRLDINEYSIDELRSLLNLRKDHTVQEVLNSERSLRNKLIGDAALSSVKKQQIQSFLGLVKKKLLGINVSTPATQHNVIPRPMSEDARDKVEDYINPNFNIAANLLPTSHLRRRLLCLDSRFRDNYYTTISTNYQMTLPTVIKNVISMELSSLELPGTYYQIAKSLGNNYFWLGWAAPVLPPTAIPVQSLLSWYYISIPDGNYQRSEIETALNEQISYATKEVFISTTQKVLRTSDPPSCIIDTHSTKTVFAISPNGATVSQRLEIRFNLTRGGNTSTSSDPHLLLPPADLAGEGGIISNLGWILGYRMAEYTGSQAYVSEGCYDAWGTKYFYIVVDDFSTTGNNFIIPIYNSSLGSANILARIPAISAASDQFSQGLSLNSNQFSVDPAIKHRNYFGPIDVQRLRIQILDEFGRIIDLNNMDMSMAIDCVFLYD